MKSKRPPGLEDVAWITPDGYFDPAKFPIEGPIRQCLDPAAEGFRHGCRFLGSLASSGRVEAGIYLLGLLRYHQEDLAVATNIVEGLESFHDRRCASALFGELRRVPSSNHTRGYHNTVIRALKRFPAAIVVEGFLALAADSSFSYRMRRKFSGIVGELLGLDGCAFGTDDGDF